MGSLACLVDEIAGASLAVLGVFAFAPLMAFIALVIRLDSPGPVFLKQTRQGYRQRDIEVFTFRTLRQNGDRDRDMPTHRGRPASTRIGEFLRNSSLDKLPQLLAIARTGTPLSAYGFWFRDVLGEA